MNPENISTDIRAHRHRRSIPVPVIRPQALATVMRIEMSRLAPGMGMANASIPDERTIPLQIKTKTATAVN